MCARWAQNYYESPEPPIVQQTIIACWLPCKYYFVSTIQIDTSSPLLKLTRCIENVYLQTFLDRYCYSEFAL